MINNSLILIRNEINKVWNELQKTSTKEELNKIREDLIKAREDFKKFVTKNDLKNELKKFATKNDLKNELKKFATKNDLKNELTKYATKEDLDNRIQKSVEDLIDFIQITNNETKKELREDITQFKDDILTEIIKLREDITVVVGYRDQIEDHEIRINSLEKKSTHN